MSVRLSSLTSANGNYPGLGTVHWQWLQWLSCSHVIVYSLDECMFMYTIHFRAASRGWGKSTCGTFTFQQFEFLQSAWQLQLAVQSSAIPVKGNHPQLEKSVVSSGSPTLLPFSSASHSLVLRKYVGRHFKALKHHPARAKAGFSLLESKAWYWLEIDSRKQKQWQLQYVYGHVRTYIQ